MAGAIPKNLEWIKTIGPLPVLLATGLNYAGISEFQSKSKNNPVIMDMANRLGLSGIYPNDETAWCALFIFFLLLLTGKPFPSVGKDKYNYLRANTFKGYGERVNKGEEILGDIGVFNRKDGKHVGILIARVYKNNKWYWIVFGGNQGNAVSFMELDESRLEETRRYYATGAPASAKRYTVTSIGLVSENEA